jgi:hypothetical protein
VPASLSTLVVALGRFEQRWTSGRRVLAPLGVVALIAAVAIAALVASAGGVPAKEAAASRPTRPHYLISMGVLVRDGSLPPPALTGDAGPVGVPPGTPKAPTTPDPGQVARQGPVIAPYGGAPGTLTPAGIATLALEHGCDPAAAVTATAIAMAESGGSPSAQGDIGLMTPVWDWSAGLWQIRGLRSERNTGGLRDSIANQGVDRNAAAMNTISNGCTDWTPWSTFNSGAYRQFAGLAEQAVRYVVAYYNSHGRHYPSVPAPDPNASIPSQGTGSAPVGPAQGARGPGAAQAGPSRHRSAAPQPGGSRPAGAPASTTGATPAPAPARSSTSEAGGVPLPLPTTSAPVKITVPPLPLPTTTLPLPLPTLPHLP